MRANVEHDHILREHVVILSIETLPRPHVGADSRVLVDDLGYTDDVISHITAQFGYVEDPNVPEVLRLADAADVVDVAPPRRDIALRSLRVASNSPKVVNVL
jgi:KUP system potassium uptake protein